MEIVQTAVRRASSGGQPPSLPSVYSLTLDEWKEWLAAQGEKPFRATQIYEWLYEKRVTDFAEMTNLPKRLREQLAASFSITTLKTIVKQTSKDGTIKFCLSSMTAIRSRPCSCAITTAIRCA